MENHSSESGDPGVGMGPDSAPATPFHRRVPLWKKLIFTICLAFLLVALVEGVLRVCGYPTGRVRTLSKLWNTDAESYKKAIGVFRPGAEATVSWPEELSYTVRVNQLGLRGREVLLEKTDGSFRILCLGDSTTFGYYVEEAHTYPAILERLLSDRSRPIEVINAGCGKWSLADESDFLEERAIRLGPDLIVLTVCANDVADVFRTPTLYREQQAELGRTSLVRLWHESAIYELALLAQLGLKKQRDGVPDPLAEGGLVRADFSQADLSREWAAQENHLSRMKKVAEAHGARLVVTFFPDPPLVRGLFTPTLLEGHARICETLGIPFFSALTRFREADAPGILYFEPIDFHTTARGNEILAQEAQSFLDAQGLLPK